MLDHSMACCEGLSEGLSLSMRRYKFWDHLSSTEIVGNKVIGGIVGLVLVRIVKQTLNILPRLARKQALTMKESPTRDERFKRFPSRPQSTRSGHVIVFNQQ